MIHRIQQTQPFNRLGGKLYANKVNGRIYILAITESDLTDPKKALYNFISLYDGNRWLQYPEESEEIELIVNRDFLELGHTTIEVIPYSDPSSGSNQVATVHTLP